MRSAVRSAFARVHDLVDALAPSANVLRMQGLQARIRCFQRQASTSLAGNSIESEGASGLGRERRWCIRRDDRDQHARTAATDHRGSDDRRDRRQPGARAERRPQTSGHRRSRGHRPLRPDLCRWLAPADTCAEHRPRVLIPFRSAPCHARRTGCRRLRPQRPRGFSSSRPVRATR